MRWFFVYEWSTLTIEIEGISSGLLARARARIVMRKLKLMKRKRNICTMCGRTGRRRWSQNPVIGHKMRTVGHQSRKFGRKSVTCVAKNDLIWGIKRRYPFNDTTMDRSAFRGIGDDPPWDLSLTPKKNFLLTLVFFSSNTQSHLLFSSTIQVLSALIILQEAFLLTRH